MKNRVGEKWNNLTIIKFDRGEKKFQGGYRYYWFCECICGTIKSIMYGNLQSGSVKSCGCLKSELISNTNTTHGHTKKKNISPEFNSWNGMFYRCYNTNCDSYKYYGGRGITVCDRWLNSFKNFLEDMGFKPDKSYSIDRINNDLGYYKENCRWATKLEQSNNQSTNKIIIDNIGNEYTSISEAARNINMKQSTLYYQVIGKNPNTTNLKLKKNETTI